MLVCAMPLFFDMARSKTDGNTTLLVDKVNSDPSIDDGHLLGVSATLSDNTGLQDAFGRLRVSNPENVFDSQLHATDASLFWFEKITDNSGSGTTTYLGDQSSKQLTVGNNDEIIRQTKQYFRYQPGKSQLVFCTFVLSAVATGLVQRVGYFDGDDGLFLETTGTTVQFVRRTSTSGSAVNNNVAQANWNIDTLDGTGASGVTLDLSKSQILVIDMEWLGVGRARMGFVVDGKIYYAHEFLNTNSLDVVYMKRATLPVRYEISYAGAGTKSMKAICTMVASEGGATKPTSIPFSASNDATLVDVGTTVIPLISVRPRQTFGGSTNRTSFEFDAVAVFSEDNPAHYHIIYGASLDGASWVNVDGDYSGMQVDVSSTGLSSGITTTEGYLGGGGTGNNRISSADSKSLLGKMPLALDIDGNHPTSPLSNVFTIAAQRVGGTNTDMAAAILWEEAR